MAFGTPFGSSFGTPFRSMTGRRSAPNAFGSEFDDPFASPTASGRSYMDPQRSFERSRRREDRAERRGLANLEAGGGGGSRGGGGGGNAGGLPMPQMPTRPGMPAMQPLGMINPAQGNAPIFNNLPSQEADLAAISFGNAPQMGMDYAQAAARIKSGTGNIQDYLVVQQSTNPTQSSNYNQAAARQHYRRMMSMQNPNGLVGAAQSSLYT